MERKIDLTTAGRDDLIDITVRQQAIIQGPEQRITQREGPAKRKGSRRMPGLKPKEDGKPAQFRKPRQLRSHGFARTRMTPTQRVEHVLEGCPGCGTRLSGGWVQRTREVIDLPQVPAQVAGYVCAARTCPLCRRRCIPKAQPDGAALASIFGTWRAQGLNPLAACRQLLSSPQL